ncbi:hypothetical protein Tsubulata_045863, partial [Turnera subulata]
SGRHEQRWLLVTASVLRAEEKKRPDLLSTAVLSLPWVVAASPDLVRGRWKRGGERRRSEKKRLWCCVVKGKRRKVVTARVKNRARSEGKKEVNVIVAFLVGESKLVGSSESPSPSAEIYDDYVERSRSLRRASTLQGKATEEQPGLELNLMEEKASDIIQDQKGIMEEKASDNIIQEKRVMELEDKEVIDELPKKVDKQEEDEDINEEKEEIDEEENGLPTEELNRRVEEFIARVNKQRLLETRLLICCKA